MKNFRDYSKIGEYEYATMDVPCGLFYLKTKPVRLYRFIDGLAGWCRLDNGQPISRDYNVTLAYRAYRARAALAEETTRGK